MDKDWGISEDEYLADLMWEEYQKQMWESYMWESYMREGLREAERAKRRREEEEDDFR